MQIARVVRKLGKVVCKVDNAEGNVGDGIDDDQTVTVENPARAERLPDGIRRRAHRQKHHLQKVGNHHRRKYARRIVPDDGNLRIRRRPKPGFHQFGKAAGAHLLGIVGEIKGAPRIFLRTAMRLFLHVCLVDDAVRARVQQRADNRQHHKQRQPRVDGDKHCRRHADVDHAEAEPDKGAVHIENIIGRAVPRLEIGVVRLGVLVGGEVHAARLFHQRPLDIGAHLQRIALVVRRGVVPGRIEIDDLAECEVQNEAGKHHGENLRKRRAGLCGIDRIAQQNHIGQGIAKAVCRVGKPGHEQKAGRGAVDHPKRKARVFQHGKRLLLFLLLLRLRHGACSFENRVLPNKFILFV